jgi:hypothetical protein
MSQDEKDRLRALWPADEPPADFADRVLAAAQGTRTATERPLKARRWLAGAALMTAAALVALLVRPGGASTATGRALVTERQTLQLGGRGLAVAEAGAELGWSVSGAAARVEQPAGNVFYRVEKGGPFVVHTPAGDVRVQGTCFRVEVDPMKKTLWSMGAGAALASAVLVTVYEGKVLLANEKGQTTLTAGMAARAEAGRAPSPADDARATVAAQALTQPPADGLTREQLLQRDVQQRTELERLRTRLHQLEANGAEGNGDKKSPGSFTNVSKDELREMAKDCKLKWDMPDIGIKPRTISDDDVQRLGLSDQERTDFNRVSADFNSRVTQQIRALYVEATGDKAGAESLTARAMENEIMEKSNEADIKQAFYDISHERAGLQKPPVDVGGEPPVERMQRLLSSLGDQFEQDLGKAIGPDRAHQMRTEHDGWGSRHTSSVGCP